MALAKSQKSLKDWTAQKWKTSDGKPSKGDRDGSPSQRKDIYLKKPGLH